MPEHRVHYAVMLAEDRLGSLGRERNLQRQLVRAFGDRRRLVGEVAAAGMSPTSSASSYRIAGPGEGARRRPHRNGNPLVPDDLQTKR